MSLDSLRFSGYVTNVLNLTNMYSSYAMAQCSGEKKLFNFNYINLLRRLIFTFMKVLKRTIHSP